MGTAATFAVGIDVSKDTLDACLVGPDGRARRKGFANRPQGFVALAAWADRYADGAAIHFCLEATGPYSDGIATHLADAGRLVSVANPAQVRAYARACGQGNKTDPADARVIADFCRDRHPRAWVPPSPAVRRVRALTRRRDDLRRMAAAEKTRLAAPDLTPDARQSLRRVIRFLAREADRVQAEAEAVIAAEPRLAAGGALLASVKGIGRQTATTVLAELPPVDQLPRAQSAAAYAGLAPREFRSGTSVRKRTRLSKTGNARLRTALYLPTLAAIRSNPVIRRFYDRLVGRGKPRMQAVGACMRKLLMICYGVLKGGRPFDPGYSRVRPADGGSPGRPPSAGRTPISAP